MSSATVAANRASDPAPLRDRVARGALDAVVSASAESLRNLLDIAGGEIAPKLTALPLFVVHPNIAESARTLGFSTVIVTETSDQGVAERYHCASQSAGMKSISTHCVASQTTPK